MEPSKITIIFNTPGVLDYALEDLPRDLAEDVRGQLARWVQWGEFIKVEFDLVNNTAIVIPVRN